jgi:hypothetical protein
MDSRSGRINAARTGRERSRVSRKRRAARCRRCRLRHLRTEIDSGMTDRIAGSPEFDRPIRGPRIRIRQTTGLIRSVRVSNAHRSRSHRRSPVRQPRRNDSSGRTNLRRGERNRSGQLSLVNRTTRPPASRGEAEGRSTRSDQPRLRPLQHHRNRRRRGLSASNRPHKSTGSNRRHGSSDSRQHQGWNTRRRRPERNDPLRLARNVRITKGDHEATTTRHRRRIGRITAIKVVAMTTDTTGGDSHVLCP